MAGTRWFGLLSLMVQYNPQNGCPQLLKKKSDASAASPAWHPNLRIVEQLPDTKVVRTAFFVNGLAATIAIVLALYLGHQEWKLHGV
jgi:hypothetical protein